MLKSKAVKLVQVMLDFHGYMQSSEEAITAWLRQEIGNTNIAFDLLEAQVDALLYNQWAVGRLYLTEKRLGVVAA